MEFPADKLEAFKENPKTQYFASQFEVLLKQREESETMAKSDPDMAELAEEDIRNINSQLEALFKQMSDIIESSKTEEEKPYGVMLEVRAGAGGD